jgi:hypothetical protein
MKPMMTAILAFLDGFSFADLVRPARIPGSPTSLFAPDGFARKNSIKQPTSNLTPTSVSVSPKIGHAGRT